MRSAAILLAACLAVAAAAPADVVRGEMVDKSMEQVKAEMAKGFFEDLAQVTQNILQQAHKLAEQIIHRVEQVAHDALSNLQKDKPVVPAAEVPTAAEVTAAVNAAPADAPAPVPEAAIKPQNDEVAKPEAVQPVVTVENPTR
ncbi:translation initiation factor IF-2-like [Thrips palmi]|uniref:Translation initiation factor IF-2-like n=1 Tax=Thrips palmi TaxID=161013 RepID=A0A6P8ZTF9_THRPL|nr:translation initiation factor IF-2-like [Thrips palmi]